MIWRAVAILIVVASVGGATAATPTKAASTQEVYVLEIAEDRFFNYDFEERISSKWGVDWAVSLLFWNNATIRRVKQILANEYDRVGGDMHGLFAETIGPYQNPNYQWDTDAGRKTTLCPGGAGQPDWARHYRIYADELGEGGDDRLYNMYWGYWVFGADHYDFEECPGGAISTFGYSENAEDWITWRWRENGFGATDDWSSFYNYEPYRVEGNHIWDNNGLASALYVP
jgi:hypothetical protein